MEFRSTTIPDVITIDPVLHEDDRGFMMETWTAEQFSSVGIDAYFVMHLLSRSTGGTIRGVHYQVTQPQGKLIRVLRGEIFDVAVDLRRSSEYFGQWVSEILSGQNHRMIWIPPGFGHAFMVLSNEAEIEYRMTNSYAPEHERTIRWDDPDIDIEWPENLHGKPFVSRKDSQALSLRDAELYD